MKFELVSFDFSILSPSNKRFNISSGCEGLSVPCWLSRVSAIPPRFEYSNPPGLEIWILDWIKMKDAESNIYRLTKPPRLFSSTQLVAIVVICEREKKRKKILFLCQNYRHMNQSMNYRHAASLESYRGKAFASAHPTLRHGGVSLKLQVEANLTRTTRKAAACQRSEDQDSSCQWSTEHEA
jgi:hypothetical protein